MNTLSAEHRVDRIEPAGQQAAVPHKTGRATPPALRPAWFPALLRAVAGELAELARLLSRGYMEVLLLQDGWIGLVFAVGTFLYPQAGCCGLLAMLSAYGFGRTIGMNPDAWKIPMCLSNPLLVGLGLGSYLSPSWATAFFVAVMGVVTLVATIGLAHVFQTYLRLPILTLPFVLCMSVAFLASMRYTNLPIATSRPLGWPAEFSGLPTGIEWFLRSLGSVLFVPHPAVGLLFACLILGRSRIFFLLAASGFATGVAVRSLLLGSYLQAVAHPCNYNFILIAMVLGGLFCVPSLKSYLVALTAVMSAAILLDCTEVWWALQGLPAYALPFNVVALSFLFALGLVGFSHMPRVVGRTPEETLQADLALRWRFTGNVRTLRLPFFGGWSVWQAFDGPWTHQGDWKYAYDFVIADEHGKTFSGPGLSLADYYCFKRPVAAPVHGRVVKVIADLPDNEPGEVNGTHNWGNAVVIYDERGFYVQISHFARSSMRVAEGAWVEPGMVLGLCGNSGFSPQPHVHIQVQATAAVGAATLPFRFVGTIEAGRFESSGLPAPGQCVAPMVLDPGLQSCTEFLLGDELLYAVECAGRHVAELRLQVRVAVDGTLFFESQRGGRLYFGKRDGTFFFYRVEGPDPYLALLLRALPRLPLTCQDDLSWTDSLPASLLLVGIRRAALQLGSSFIPSVERLRCRLRFESRNEVSCRSESRLLRLSEEARTTFDGDKGPAAVRLGPWELRRR